MSQLALTPALSRGAGEGEHRRMRKSALVLAPDVLRIAEHFDRQRKRARFARTHRADADDLAIDLLVAIVADREHHRVLPRFAVGRMPDRAFDAKRRRRFERALGHVRIEADVVLALRTDVRAFEDRRLAVRTGPCRAGGTGALRPRTRCAHEPDPFSAPLRCDFDEEGFSSQPNSTWPRLREPPATVSEPALRSPMRTPVCCSSTCNAASMLPSSSPATVIFLARTLPLSFASFSIVRSPCTFTSPLNLPAMRTWPVPSILPSMVRSAAINDSLGSLVVAGAARGGAVV